MSSPPPKNRKSKIAPSSCAAFRLCRSRPFAAATLSAPVGKIINKPAPVCGIELPPGLRLAARFDSPLYTPATKAEQGAHDENISQSRVAQIIGAEAAAKVRAAALRLYELGAQFAAERGVILADTKFEFALEDGEPTLIDEALTPDSSRFWPADEYREGENPPSFR